VNTDWSIDDRFTVVWTSEDLPQQGIAAVGTWHPEKRAPYARAMDETLRDVADGALVLPGSSDDTNAIGVCNDEAYRKFAALVVSHAADPACDLGLPKR
jgi:hypothetical protein